MVAEKLPGQRPRLVARHEELLEMPGLDAVIIATPDFAHPAVLVDAVRAGKDAFVEKPLSARLEDAVAALDAVEEQRSHRAGGHAAPEQRALPRGRRVRAVRSARPDLQDRDGLEPQRAELGAAGRHVRREDVDWDQFQMYLPKREFDPVRYRCWHFTMNTRRGSSGCSAAT